MFESFPNFITDDEINQIKEKVIELRSHWRVLAGDWFIFGDALYILQGEGLGLTSVDKEIQKVLADNFGWIYARLCNKIYQITGKKTILHPKLPLPGFHISELKQPYFISFFHTDSSITDYITNVKMNDVSSLLVLIEKPTDGAWLEAKVNNEITKHNYDYGVLHRWKSTVPHRVGQFNTGQDERRITLQCHYYYNPTLDCNLVYF